MTKSKWKKPFLYIHHKPTIIIIGIDICKNCVFCLAKIGKKTSNNHEGKRDQRNARSHQLNKYAKYIISFSIWSIKQENVGTYVIKIGFNSVSSIYLFHYENEKPTSLHVFHSLHWYTHKLNYIDWVFLAVF